MSTFMNLALYLLEPQRDELLLSLPDGQTFHRPQLRSATAWLSEALAAEGLTNTRVAIDLAPTFGAIAAYLALLLNGNTVVAARRVNQAPFKGYLAAASTDAIVGAKGTTITIGRDPDQIGPSAGDSGRGSAVLTLPQERIDAPPPVDLEALAVVPERPAVDLFTSGTTGRPKMVELSHDALHSSTEAILAALPITQATRTALILSLAHSFGMSVLHTHLRAGAALHCVERPEFPGDVLKALTDGRCNSIAAVPAQLRAITATLQKSPPGGDEVDIALVMQAGGRMEVSDSQSLLTTLGGHCRLYPMYGQTEAAARIAILDAEDRERVPGSVGKPLQGLQVRVVDADGHEVEAGGEGEVTVYGTTLMDGYHDDQKATDEVLRAGWLHTGDFGYVDAEGFLYITGRRSNFVKIDGERISLEAVEHAAITAVPDRIADALAFPVRSDEGDGWAISLDLHLSPDSDSEPDAGAGTGPSPEAFAEIEKVVRHRIRTTMGGKAVPATIAPTDAVPYTPNGKKTRVNVQY